MPFERNTAKPGNPPQIEPYATTPRGYPYPLRSWAPDAAVDIQNLATAVDTDIGKLGHAVVEFNYASVPGSSAILTATSISATSGAAIGSIVSQKFRLTNAGTYTINVIGWQNVAGDAWPLPFGSTRKYTAAKDLFLTYYNAGTNGFLFYLSPDEVDAGGTYSAFPYTSTLSLRATMFVNRIA